MTDWPSLAARFEAATDDDICECVRALVRATAEARPGFDWWTLIVGAASIPHRKFPDLLLGVVVACVPSGWWWGIDEEVRGEFAARVDHWKGRDAGAIYVGSSSPAAALGAAVCRAWESVGKGEVE